MSQINTNHQRLANYFVDLRHCGDNHTYLTKSKAKGLLDIPFVNTQIYGMIYVCQTWLYQGLEQVQKQFLTFALHKCRYLSIHY